MKNSKNKNQLKEIERKFLIKILPENLDNYSYKEIIQGYVGDNLKNKEIRLRKKGNKFYHTEKIGSGKIRVENEKEINEEKFNSLWNCTLGKRVQKTRYEIPYNKKIIELDFYHDTLDGLIIAEVEFSSEVESNEFIIPNWFGEEVTENKFYKNKNLALFGKPKGKIISEYELKRGIIILIKKIKEKIKTNSNKSIVVQVAGGSASGKTSTVAKKIVEEIGSDAVLISMDDYYKGNVFKKEELAKGRVLNWDQPKALHIDTLKKHLIDLKNGKIIEKPIFDFKISDPSGFEKIVPKKVIVVEGLFALNDILKDEGDIKVFVDIGTHGRVMRKLLRDIERTGQTPSDLLKYFSEIVQPMHDKYIQSTKQNADIIIKNEYCPKIEAERSGIHEIQLKFRGVLNQEFLRRLGAEKLSNTIQIDNYYNPKDRDLIDTDEMLRIREESSNTHLVYKGPRIESQYRDRPKFEFNIDNETKNKFLSIYGDRVKIIKKERTLYQFENLVFSLDKVTKIDKDEKKEVGDFIEIRTTNKVVNKQNLSKIISRLGLNINDGIKESYFELAI